MASKSLSDTAFCLQVWVPSGAMLTGDFTNDAFGHPTGNIINPNASAANTPFQCDASNNPVPANANGTQTPVAGGGPCNKIPGNLIDPIGQALLNLYPHPNVTGQSGFNFEAAPVRKLDETKVDIKVDHKHLQLGYFVCPLQLRSSGFLRARRLGRDGSFCRGQRFWQQPGLSEPRAQHLHSVRRTSLPRQR